MYAEARCDSTLVHLALGVSPAASRKKVIAKERNRVIKARFSPIVHLHGHVYLGAFHMQ